MSLALVDAGVPMKFMIASMSCMIDRTTNEIVMDPTTKELEVSHHNLNRLIQ